MNMFISELGARNLGSEILGVFSTLELAKDTLRNCPPTGTDYYAQIWTMAIDVAALREDWPKRRICYWTPKKMQWAWHEHPDCTDW